MNSKYWRLIRPIAWITFLLPFSVGLGLGISSESNPFHVVFAVVTFVFLMCFCFVVNTIADKDVDKYHNGRSKDMNLAQQPIATGEISMKDAQYLSIVFGIFVFLLGAFVYFKWEIYWTKVYKGQLVTGGIFKYIRHPHYTSLLIVGFGLALFFYSIFALFIAIIAIPIMILSIFDEEKLLIKQYGEEYKEFMKKTPYRIIPKLF